MRESLEAKPVDVFNLSSEDLNIVGALELGGLEETVILSTNLIPPDSAGFGNLKKFAVQEAVLANGWPVKIGFLGIADPRMVKPNSGFSAKDPVDAIAEILPGIKDDVDLVVVVGEMSEETADKIAGTFPEIYAVLRSERSMRMTRPRQVSNALIMSSVERGRMLGQITLVLDAGKKIASYTYKYVDLNQRIPGNPALEARAKELLE